MSGSSPAWWMRRSPQMPQTGAHEQNGQEPQDCAAQASPAPAPDPLRGMMQELPRMLLHADGETLLLIALIRMLRQDHADRKLLLALAYILL